MSWEIWIAAPLVGLVGMMSGGYWGVGCGWIVVPVMLMCGFEPLQAVGIGLLQMVPSTLPTVIRQCPKIGWRRGEPGRTLVLPLAVGAVLTSLLGKPVNRRLFAAFGGRPLDVLLCCFIAAIMIQTLCSRTRCYDDSMPPITRKTGLCAFFGGLFTGFLSSLLGVGGGIVIRPLLTSGFKVPEALTGRIVRLQVLLTTLVGGTTYLFGGNGVDWHLFGIAMLVAAGGMFGFPIGAEMHRIVYDAGYAQHIHKSFAVVAFALLANTFCRMAGHSEWSFWIMAAIGLGLTAYLISFTRYARRHPKIPAGSCR